MSLDPQLAAWFERLGREFGPLPDTAPRTRRKRYLDITHLLEVPAPAGVAVRELRLPLAGREIGARLYHPGAAQGRAPALLVFYHGGGWVTGSLETHHGLCQRIASQSGVAVASVDYRLAPESPFPAPCEDAYDALLWLAAHADELGCDARRIGVGGDSAGAHLAAVTALTVRQNKRTSGLELMFQWLIYPTIAPDFSLRSYAEFGQGPGLTKVDMEWFWRQFLGEEMKVGDHRASPAAAATLAGLPPAYVLVAALDPLRDEGERYATQLKQAGVATTMVRAPGMTHGFARLFPVSESAKRHIDAAITALKEGMA
jgi:acetyl esterase